MKGLCKRLISFMLAVCMMVSMVPLGFAAEEQEANSAVSTISGNVKRIAGDDRIATSLGIATQLKDTLNVEKFETVVVASALNFPDALTGSYLAAKESAPILLTYEAANAKVQTYIENNLKDGGTVYILGGSTAVSTGFEDDLSAKGINVVRLAGSDRFGTNLAILQQAGVTSQQELLICTATGFADSLSASAAGRPILLVHGSLKPDQKDYLTSIFGAEGNYTIIGGEAAVSADIEQELAAMGTVKRLGGSSRYETSVLVAENFFGTTPGGAVLAYARNFPDGLCAGPLAYAMNAPLILTDNYDPREADEYVVGTSRGFVVGGPSLISDVATRAIFDLGSGTQKPVHTVSFIDSISGNTIDVELIEEGLPVPEPTPAPAKDGYHFAGWYADQACTETYDFSAPVTSDTSIYAGWLSLHDTDGDGLADGAETHYGTDIHKQDSDDDGLNDYVEVVILGTDPLSPSTDGSSESDADQDSDGDGISNADEIANGTNPGDNDTDADLLPDDEELSLGTDPANYDTDGDGASDGTEIRLGTDPLTADESFSMTATAENEDAVVPSVDIVLQGEQVDTLTVEPFADPKMFPEDMPGYLGQAYDFNVSGEFESADIHFEFDISILDTGAEPTIFYFNEQTQLLEELATTIEGNVATATVEHFSTYVLVDRKVFYSSFTWEDVWETEGTFHSVEIVFVIDDSGSMGPVGANNDPNNERLSVSRDLIDKLPEDSKIGIVWFADNTSLLTPKLTTDRDAAKSFLTTTYFKSVGSTYMYTAINDAFTLFESTAEDVLRMMVVLSDGSANDSSKHSSTIAAAQSERVQIYTVGLGGSSSSYFTNYLRPLAESTGGTFYLASNADALASIYDDINKKIDLSADSDKDGVPDYYEDNMVAFNGTPIHMDKLVEDTDGDKLKDGQEVEIVKIPNAEGTQVRVVGKLHSYPDKIDSDNDSINDYHDPDPMSYTITDRVLSWVEGLSYTNLEGFIGQTVGYALEHGAKLDGISSDTAQYLKEAIIYSAGNSGEGFYSKAGGLGFVALKITRRNMPTAIIYALRGTENDDDFVKDWANNIDLGFSWDSKQSKYAFTNYKNIAQNSSFDYYVVGHSLGGRLAQDVVYKVYNSNEGFFFYEGTNIPEPVHAVTFNALGYNAVTYALLENDILKQFKSDLTNYYYFSDLVGEGLGATGQFKHTGTDVKLWGKKINGTYLRTEEERDAWIYVRDIKYHGIATFHNDYDLLYATSDAPSTVTLPGSKLTHPFTYWVD